MSYRFTKLPLVALILSSIIIEKTNSLIITSVIAGDKKFKTISFDSKFMKPLTFEKDLPFPTQFRSHRTIRPPKFDIDINIPIKLPLEDEYIYEKPEKPTFNDIFFETTDVKEDPTNSYPRNGHKPMINNGAKYNYPQKSSTPMESEIINAYSNQRPEYLKPDISSQAIEIKSHQTGGQSSEDKLTARSDGRDMVQQANESQETKGQPMVKSYGHEKSSYPNEEFVPGGFVNFKLSGPEGGPKMTHQDYNREYWSQQLRATYGSMPFPILNYNQLQNYYGGLGTFTNGLPENQYVEHNLIDQIKSGLSDFTGKFKIAKLFRKRS